MEELHHSWNLYADHDFRILSNHLWWPIGTDDNGNFDGLPFNLAADDINVYDFVADIAGSSEMLRRNYFDWISSVSYSWFAVVP